MCGVGSRETTTDKLEQMSRISKQFSKLEGAILRSSGAIGADQAFENSWKGKKEIFLPWNGYEDKFHNPSKGFILPKMDERHEKLAASVHPVWDRLKQGAKKMHTRNVCQVLGENLDTPATLLVCWTVGGQLKGGTATAIKLALNASIPVYNLAIESDVEKLRELF